MGEIEKGWKNRCELLPFNVQGGLHAICSVMCGDSRAISINLAKWNPNFNAFQNRDRNGGIFSNDLAIEKLPNEQVGGWFSNFVARVRCSSGDNLSEDIQEARSSSRNGKITDTKRWSRIYRYVPRYCSSFVIATYFSRELIFPMKP